MADNVRAWQFMTPISLPISSISTTVTEGIDIPIMIIIRTFYNSLITKNKARYARVR